jgi:hypothetical protein
MIDRNNGIVRVCSLGDARETTKDAEEGRHGSHLRAATLIVIMNPETSDWENEKPSGKRIIIMKARFPRCVRTSLGGVDETWKRRSDSERGQPVATETLKHP